MNKWTETKNSREYMNIGYVLVYIKGGFRSIYIARWDTGHGWTGIDGFSIRNKVTNFMRLESPTSEAVENEIN